MISVWAIASRLGYEGKHRGERVRRLLRQIERSTGRTLLIDHGEDARPRYFVEAQALAELCPSLMQDIQPDPDARVAELLDEVESLRDLHTALVRRVAALEAAGRVPRRVA